MLKEPALCLLVISNFCTLNKDALVKDELRTRSSSTGERERERERNKERGLKCDMLLQADLLCSACWGGGGLNNFLFLGLSYDLVEVFIA